MGVTLVQSAGDGCRNSVRIAERIIVPKSDYAVAFGFNQRRSLEIPFAAVLPAIDFNHDARAVTRKIDNEIADRNLTAKPLVGEVLTKKVPDCVLSVGRVVPKLARSRNRACRRSILHHLVGLPSSPLPTLPIEGRALVLRRSALSAPQ